MADLLTNFDIGDGLIDFKPKLKGGNWRHRLSLQRSRQQHQKQNSDGQADVGAGVSEPPRKKFKSDFQRAGRPRGEQNDRAQGERGRLPNAKEVISSLFTYNPESKTLTTPTDQDEAQDFTPSNAPLPEGIESFTSLGMSTTLAAHLMTKMEIKTPTSIQKDAIPMLLQGESDAFIQSQTGSGKTLAYLLPLVQRIMALSASTKAQHTESVKVHRDSGLFALVLAPTRELSKQISVVLDNLLRCANWIVSGSVIGGEKKKSEKARLRKGLNILVATPGRLVDHLSHTTALDVSSVRWLILDEGDRLMELGFEEDIKAIVKKLEEAKSSGHPVLPGLPSRRVTVLCSATMKMNVQRLGEISLQDAMHIQGVVDPGDRAKKANGEIDGNSEFSAPAQLKQSFIVVPAKQRFVTLCALLRHTFARRGSVMKTMVFLSCADTVEFHFSALSRDPSSEDELNAAPNGARAPLSSKQDAVRDALSVKTPENPSLKLYKLHGSLPQSTRTSTLASFSGSTEPSILLCTDVASRGLDLPSIDFVIEYDPAFSADDHLHRIGRTARAGKDGRATIFLLPGAEEEYVQVLKDSYKGDTGARVARQDAEEVMKRGFATGEANSSKQSKTGWQDAATEFQLETERWVQSDLQAREMARKAYISHVRAYATHVVPERHVFDIKRLHLGHLAKAFGLRDKPGNMGRGSTADKNDRRRPRGQSSAAKPAVKRQAAGAAEDISTAAVDRNEAAAKMRKAMKAHMSVADEFNLG